MYQFNKKQKIILGVITAIIAGFICYYVYAKEDNTMFNQELENNIETKEDFQKEREDFSDEVIFVHVSGAVVKEGVVELKVNSRIEEAIAKARRSKRGCLCRSHQFSLQVRRWHENSYSHQAGRGS